MKFNQWTLALASVGIVSLGSVAHADEHPVTSVGGSTTLSGYVDTSAIWKLGSGAGPLPGRSFDGADKVDGFNLNVVKVSLEKALGDANAWSAGYKADLLFGPDANAYGTLMNGPAGGTSQNGDEISIKQAYVALRAPIGNGLDIKMGVWDTLIGYEFFDSSSNPNYSRSYGFAMEPLHHTGVMASYKITDMFAITGGVANGTAGTAINTKDTTESKKSYLAALTVTLPEGAGSFKNSTISAGFINGTVPGTGAQTQRNYYVGATFNTPVEGLTFGAAWDYLENPKAGGPGSALVTADGASADAYAVAAYVGFGMDKWKLNLRADYTQATAGFWYAGGNGNNGVAKTDRDELGSLTATLDYNLWENVLTRLEGRWDRALSGDTPFGTNDENAFTVALSAVYKF